MGLRGISTWNCWAMWVSSSGPPQSGQASGKRLVGFIDLVGPWRLAVGFGAVVFAGLAAGLLWLAGGRALGEGGGLALAGALRLL